MPCSDGKEGGTLEHTFRSIFKERGEGKRSEKKNCEQEGEGTGTTQGWVEGCEPNVVNPRMNSNHQNVPAPTTRRLLGTETFVSPSSQKGDEEGVTRVRGENEVRGRRIRAINGQSA